MRRILTLLIWLVLPIMAQAQTAATLVADQVTVTADRRLVAAGNVEVFFDGTRVTASAITYDQETDRLSITGPIFIRTAEGTIFTADRASLDPRLENGILIGARLVLAEQLQLAATQIDRVEGRYTQLTRVAATSCQVCGTRPPLWEIRAGRVIHDQAEQQLYFDNATFHIRGVPVFWVPRMRLPDPTLTRATGLLIPQYRSADRLGLGIKLPYFIRLSDDRDLTLTPYFSAHTKTIEGRYRQAYANGDLLIAGALSRDDIVSGETRGYLFGQGGFDLGRDFRLDFGVQMASDRTYLLDYGYSSLDRLQSFAQVTRVRADDLFVADLSFYQSLRDAEVTGSLPPVVAQVSYERRIEPALIGGTLTLGAEVESHYRTVNTPGDAGRDVARIGAQADWQRSWIAPIGIVATAHAGAGLSYYRTWQDPAYDGAALRSTQNASLTLRWPLSAVGAGGGTHVIEPVLAFGWGAIKGPAMANEDSTRIEFDEGNLLSFNRAPGSDLFESGGQIVLGGSWSRIGPGGTTSQLTFGRIWRDESLPGFTASSGLDGSRSDWLVTGQIDFPFGLQLDGRTLLNDSLTPIKSAATVGWNRGWVSLDASYVWLIADAAEDRVDAISEWTLESDFKINDTWSAGVSGRYDLATRTPANAGLSIGWQNECVTVELSASRRYATSITDSTSTDYGLSIGLSGFSAGRSGAAPRRACAN